MNKLLLIGVFVGLKVQAQTVEYPTSVTASNGCQGTVLYESYDWARFTPHEFVYVDCETALLNPDRIGGIAGITAAITLFVENPFEFRFDSEIGTLQIRTIWQRGAEIAPTVDGPWTEIPYTDALPTYENCFMYLTPNLESGNYCELWELQTPWDGTTVFVRGVMRLERVTNILDPVIEVPVVDDDNEEAHRLEVEVEVEEELEEEGDWGDGAAMKDHEGR